MSVGLCAVTGYYQEWDLSIKITFPQVCCLNIPSSDLVTVTKQKTNARTLESTVIFKTNLTSARPPQAKCVFCIGTSGYKTFRTKD